MRWILVTAVALGITVPACAQTPPEGISWYVLNEINRFYLDVDDPTNRPDLVTAVPQGVLLPVEMNGDGRADWLINWPESAQFCSTGGCRRTLYISGDDGFTRAFDRQALEFEVGTVAGEVRIEAWVHHLNCNEARPQCRFAWAWEDAARRLVPRPSSDGIAAPAIGPDPVAADAAQ